MGITAEQAKRINAKGFWFNDHKPGTCRHIDNTNQPPFIKRCRNLTNGSTNHKCAQHK